MNNCQQLTELGGKDMNKEKMQVLPTHVPLWLITPVQMAHIGVKVT